MFPHLEPLHALWQSASVIEVFAFLLGLMVGSFLNVCIYRIPRGQSIVFPGSRCPSCATPIRPYDNIPLVSWLILGGRCRVPTCRARISVQYPAVELLCGLLFLFTVQNFGISLESLQWLVLFCILIVHIVTDLQHRFLSYHLNLGGFGLGLLLSVVSPSSDGTARALTQRWLNLDVPAAVLGLADALLGALLGAGLLWIVSEGYFRITRRSGMGLGDVYLMAMIGAFLGLQRTFLTILLGSLMGSVLGLGWVGILFLSGWRKNVAERAHRRGLGSRTTLRFALARRYPLPFGTYLGVAAVFVVFFGTRILEWYGNLPGAR